jgi:hypothetical protein
MICSSTDLFEDSGVSFRKAGRKCLLFRFRLMSLPNQIPIDQRVLLPEYLEWLRNMDHRV